VITDTVEKAPVREKNITAGMDTLRDHGVSNVDGFMYDIRVVFVQ